MSTYSDKRINPIDSSFSWRTMDPEYHTVAVLDNLPGVYGFILQDNPRLSTLTITEDITGGEEWAIVSGTPSATGQVFVSNGATAVFPGLCIFNVADNGKSFRIDYEGGGSTQTVEAVSDIAEQAAIAAVPPPPSGAIFPFAGTSAPTGYLICDGSAVSRTTYSDLFTAIGTTWGTGDGSTTFNLPDLRAAVLRGAGSHGTETMANGSAYDGGSVGTYGDDKMQGHWHQSKFNESGSGANFDAPNGNITTQPANTSNEAVQVPVTDGVNGTPRTGAETKPFTATVLFVIKK